MNKHYCPYCMNETAEGEVCRSCGLTAGSYQPNQNHLPPGTVLENRYLIGRVLGEGGFGITYIGCDLKLEMKVAIKEYYPSDKVQRISSVSLEVSVPSVQAESFYEAGKQRFLQEALIMARMDKQPEIVGVRDFFECNHTAYIVMEYVEGTTFKQLVAQRGGGIPPGELLPLVEPLFGALSNLHEKGLIHRDISPDNLMLEHGAVRLLDFGCARQPEHGDATMTIQLKHGYAPVEQYTNHGQGPWTDVYALAATLYYCLVGKTPPQAMDRSLEDELILPRKLGVDLTEEQEAALIKAMNIRRNRRFATMEEFRAALYKVEPELQPVRVRLQVRNVLKNSENRGGFFYELTDGDGKVLKTAFTDAQGLTAFSLTFGKETAGYTYPYEIHQIDPGLPDVVCSTKVYALTIQIRVRNGRLTAEMQMNGMPVSEEQVFVFENVWKKTKKKPVKLVADDATTILIEEKKPKKPGLVAAAVGVVALTVALTAPSWLPKSEPEAPEKPVAEVTAPVEEAEPGLFDNAVVWQPGQDLYALLEDDSVPAVIVPEHAVLERDTVISKPVLISRSGWLDTVSAIEVTETGLLQMEGTLWTENTVQVRQGGRLLFDEQTQFQARPVILLEDWGSALMDVTQPAVEQAEGQGVFLVEYGDTGEQVFEVRTEQELRQWVEPRDGRELHITGEITLTEDLYVMVPIVVEEGATLTAPFHGDEEGSGTVSLILGPGGQLINHGTFNGSVSAFDGEAAVINYGTYNARTYFTEGAVMLNYGTVENAYGLQFFTGSRICNLGQLTIRQEGWCSGRGGEVVNLGEILVHGGMDLDYGETLHNYGQLIVSETGYLYNRALLHNEGTLDIYGSMTNDSLLRLSGSQVYREENGILENTGVILHSENTVLPDGLDGIVYCVNNDWAEGKKVVEVDTVEALEDAIHDDRVHAIAITAPITLADSGSLTLEKPLYITPSGALSMPGYSVLEIKAVLRNEGLLAAGAVGPYEDGQLLNYGQLEIRDYLEVGDMRDISSRGLLYNEGTMELGAGNIGSVMTAGSGVLLNCGEMINLRRLRMFNDSVLLQMEPLNLEQTEIALSDGQLITTAALSMQDCQVENSGLLRLQHDVTFHRCAVFQYGEVLSSQASWVVTGAEYGSMINYGNIHIWGWNEATVELGVPMENYGMLDCELHTTISRTVYNEGIIRMHRWKMTMAGSGIINGNPVEDKAG